LNGPHLLAPNVANTCFIVKYCGMIYKGELPPLRVYAWKVCGKVNDMTVAHGYIKLYLKHRVYANIYVPDLADLHAMIYKIREAAAKLGVVVKLETIKSIVFNLIKEMYVLLDMSKGIHRTIKRVLREGSINDLHLTLATVSGLRDTINRLLSDMHTLYQIVGGAEQDSRRPPSP